MNDDLKWTEILGNGLVANLAKGNTLREASELAGIPFDRLLRWIDPGLTEFNIDCVKCIQEGQYLAQHKGNTIQAKVRQSTSQTLYNPVLLPLIEQIVMTVCIEGKSLTQAALRLGISRDTLDRWRKHYSEVDEVCKLGETAAEAYLEEQAMKFMVEEPYGLRLNSKIWEHMMKVASPERHNPANKSEATLKGDKNKPLILEGININIIQSTSQSRLNHEIQGEIIDVENQEETKKA